MKTKKREQKTVLLEKGISAQFAFDFATKLSITVGTCQSLINRAKSRMPAAFVSKPASGELQFERISLLSRQGRWQEADACATNYLKAEPKDHYGYHALSALLVITLHLAEYQQLCQKFLQMFADTSNHYAADPYRPRPPEKRTTSWGAIGEGGYR